MLSNITIDPSSAVTLEYTGGLWWSVCLVSSTSALTAVVPVLSCPSWARTQWQHTRLHSNAEPGCDTPCGVSRASKPQCQKAITTIISTHHITTILINTRMETKILDAIHEMDLIIIYINGQFRPIVYDIIASSHLITIMNSPRAGNL